jgi:hypothetical protein
MGQAMKTIIIEINGKDVPVDAAFNDLTPEQKEIEKAHIADQMMAGKKFGGGDVPVAESKAKEPSNILGLPTTLAPEAGTIAGATMGAAMGPSVGTAIDKPIATAANTVRPTAPTPNANVNPNAPQSVRNWLATQTSTPYAGGRDQGEAYRKAEIAGGKPVQSRGSTQGIRRGGLGINVQPPAPTVPQKVAANILNAEQLPKAGIPRRVLGMGVAGGEFGNMIKEADEGNYGRAAFSGLGTLGGIASQSRIKPVRAAGTALSVAVPTIQKFFMGDKEDEDKSNIQEKAAGGSVTSPKLQSLSDYLDQLMQQAQSAPAVVPAPAMPQGQPPQGAMPVLPQGAMPAPQPQAPLSGMAPTPAPLPQMAKGGKVGALEAIGKKAIGFLESTPTKPNELVGTRYKTTDIGGLIEPTPFDIEKIIGAKAMHRPYDLSGRNQLVEEISGHRLINPIITEGGQPFGRDIKLQATGQGGASNKLINDRILKRVEAAAKEGDGRVFNIPSTMGYGSESFSNMPIDILLDLIKQRELPKETLEYLSNLVRAKSPVLQNFVGFGDPRVAEQFQKGGYGLGTTAGKLRVGATDVLTGKKNKAQELLDYNQEDLFNAIRAPELRDVPPGYMGETVMEAVPGHRGFNIGSHSAYDSGDASTYRGQGINAPISIWMPDTYRQALAEVRAAPKTAANALGHQRAMARNVLGTKEEGVAQTITPQVADNLQRYQEAVKSGNLDKNDLEAIHKYIYGDKADQYAKGGKVVDKVLQEAKEAFKRKFATGFFHGSPSNKIEAFDPTKSPRDPMYITPQATFVTKDPKFAESFLSMNNDGRIKAGSTMYPVNVNMGQHWDPNTPQGISVISEFIEKYPKRVNLEKGLKRGDWTAIENADFMRHLKETGHDTFHVMEGGVPNVGIFDAKNIRGKFAKYNPEDAESPDFMKAEGGAVEGYAAGGKVGNMVSLLKKLGLSEESIAAWKAANGINQRQTRNPILQQAAKDLAEGKITSEQYRALARTEMPINAFTNAPNMPSQQDIANALKSNQLETGIIGVNKNIAPGSRVSSRLDIPAYDKYDKWIVSLHDPLDAGKSIGYGQTAHLKGPIDFTAPPKAGHAIATGKSDKTTYARIHGDWEPTDPEDVYKRAQDLMGDPQWAQVGLNPFRHSYFYDKSDMAPVVGGQEALQVGPLVLVKKPQKVDPDDPRFRLSKDKPETFAAGGLAQAFNPQGEDYDYETALAYGMGPDGTGENAGHWGSVAPTSDDERMLHGLPEDSYVVLKGKSHPTFDKAKAAEKERGSKITKAGKRYYSVPK